LPYAVRGDAVRGDWMEILDNATGIFLTGGDQLRLSTILGGTAVAKTLRRQSASGIAIGGTSAGAAILSEHMIAFGKEGSTPLAGAAVLAPGFGLTNRVVIDQHFRQRDRLGRLLSALAYNPFAIGLGLDEDTAAFIDPDDRIEVVGSGAITIVDVSALTHSSMASVHQGDPICMTGISLHILTNGGTFDLHTRIARPPQASD
jgi:cyanophycinase